MSSMFNTCYSIEEILLGSNFTAGALTTMIGLTSCYNLKRFISTIDLSKITSTISITGLYNLEEFDVGAMPTVAFTLGSNLTHECLVNLINKLPEVTSSKTFTIGGLNKLKLSAEEIAVATNKGWTLA